MSHNAEIIEDFLNDGATVKCKDCGYVQVFKTMEEAKAALAKHLRITRRSSGS